MRLQSQVVAVVVAVEMVEASVSEHDDAATNDEGTNGDGGLGRYSGTLTPGETQPGERQQQQEIVTRRHRERHRQRGCKRVRFVSSNLSIRGLE